MKYRKKPVVVEAFQWFCDAVGAKHPEWFREAVLHEDIVVQGHTLHIKTLEGTMIARSSDWIIKGIKGEIYPCKSDIFEATYEPVKEQ